MTRCRTCGGSRSSCGRRRSTTSGSSPALERLTRRSRSRAGIAVDLEARLGDGRLPAEIETALYRIVQESLTNIVKHAARDARVSVVLTRDRRHR